MKTYLLTRVLKKVSDPASVGRQQEKLGRLPKKDEKVFDISSDGVRNAFRKAREFAKIEGLRFHDLRHVGCTRWSKHLSQLQLMRLTGHKDPRMLARYYNEESSEVADVMAAALIKNREK